MIENKRINAIVAIAVVFALVTSIALVVIGNIQVKNGTTKTEPEYATKIFGTDIISIEITADEDDWQEMLDNAISEQFIMVDVVVNGTKFKNVGIRPKGNSSLTLVASSDSDRYSFRLQFDEYIKGQTCFGLESFVLNNMLGDNTYMKEYISYDLMREAGVDAPYFGFANIKVNGEDWGLYLAVELYNDSYEQRVFGDTSGMLYNVKSMDMGGNEPGQQGTNAQGMPGRINNMFQEGAFGDFQQRRGAQQNTRDSQNDTGDMPAFQQGDNGTPGFNMQPDTDQDMPSLKEGQNMTPPQEDQNIPSSQGNQSITPTQGDQNMTLPQVGQGMTPPQWDQNITPPQMESETNDRGRGFRGMGERGSSGGSLEYIDDNIESYSSIFDNVAGKGTESDYKRVIEAIKALSEGRDLETYFDVDKILRYLAAHTIVVNLDSYSSGMAQNYYIYERDGKITILPWDYNLAWGGFQNGSASSVVNFPIDTPVSGVEMSSRPLIEKLFENPEYLERYHSYLQMLIDNYFADGKFEEKIKTLDALISDHVKNDATAFCTYEEYKTAVSSFITLGTLRAQSVQGQLDGTVPSTTEEQNANPDLLVPAGDLNLSDLGSMMGGRGGNNGGFPGGMGGGRFGRMKQNGGQMTPPDNAGGQNTTSDNNGGQATSPDNTGEQKASPGGVGEQWTPPGNIGEMRQWGQNMNAPNFMDAGAPANLGLANNNLILYGVLVIMLIAATIFAARFRKSY